MSMNGLPPGLTHPPKPIPPGATTEGTTAPGTLVLVFVFLVAFIVYYFVNWKLLSFLWQVG